MERIDIFDHLNATDIETQIERHADVYNLTLEQRCRELSGKFRTHFSSEKISTFKGMSLPFILVEPYLVAHDLKEIYSNLTGLQFTILALDSYGNENIEPDEPTNISGQFRAIQRTDTQYVVQFSIDFMQSQRNKFTIQGTGFGTDYSPLGLETTVSDSEDESWNLHHGFESEEQKYNNRIFFRPYSCDEVAFDQDPFEDNEVRCNKSYFGLVFPSVLEGLDRETIQYVAPRLIVKRKLAQICDEEPQMDPVMLACQQIEEGVYKTDKPTDAHVNYTTLLNSNGTKLIDYSIELDQEGDFEHICEGKILLNHRRSRLK